MGCAAGRPQQLPPLPGPIPLSPLAAPDTLTCFVDLGRLSLPALLPAPTPDLLGSGPGSFSYTVWKDSSQGL